MPKSLDPQEGGPLGGEGLDPSPLRHRSQTQPFTEGEAYARVAVALAGVCVLGRASVTM